MKLHEQQTKNDQITGSLGKEGIADSPRGLARLLFQVLQKGFYPASTVHYSYPAAVLQYRLSWHNPTAARFSQYTTHSQAQKDASLFYPLLCRKTPIKKRAFDQLLQAIFKDAQARGLIDEKPQASIDATGMETSHASQYFVHRQGYRTFQRYRWVKLTLVCHHGTHLFAGTVVSEGPSQDSPQFPGAVRQAQAHMPIDTLSGDAGYDGEHNHRLAREELGIRSTVIALNKRRDGRK